MANRYLPPASTTSDRIASRLLLPVLIVTAAVWAGPLCASDTPSLTPYTAEYKTSGRGFNVVVTRTLEADNNNHFVLTSGGKILVVGFHEISVFRVENDEVHSISYVHQNTGLVNRRKELRFDDESDTINSLYKDEWYDLPHSGNILDRVNQMEQLRLNLLSNKSNAEDMTFRVADGKRLKDSRLVLVGEETQQTALGAVSTLHYERLHDDPERKSEFWLAPEWDYLMVKMLHIEDGHPLEMSITSATLDGQIISGN